MAPNSIIFACILVLCSITTKAQKIPLFTQYFTNPYIYNPAYAGLEGRSTFTLTHRQQWVGINDAPVTSNFVYHTSLKGGVNFGVNITQDEAGIFKTTTGLLTFGYTVGLGWNHFISFGISGGGAFNSIDFNGVDVSDPALTNVLDNSNSLEGNAGLAYHIGNLNVGLALPRLFNTSTYSTEAFDKGEFDALSNYIITANYMIHFGMGSHVFQPYVLYRSYQGYDTQFEAGAIVQFKNLFWIGGNYRENYGYSGLVGLKAKSNLAIGYAYEIPANKVSGINASTHEIQISISMGKKNKRSTKHATFLASTKVEKAKKERKNADPVLATVAEKEIEPVIEDKTLDETVEEDLSPEEVTFMNKENEVTAASSAIDPDNTPPPKNNKPAVTETSSPVVTVRKGNHPFELDKGHYVIVGAFSIMQNAIRMADQLTTQRYRPGVGYTSEKKLFYVYMHEGSSGQEARNARDLLRQSSRFKDAWYLIVQ